MQKIEYNNKTQTNRNSELIKLGRKQVKQKTKAAKIGIAFRKNDRPLKGSEKVGMQEQEFNAPGGESQVKPEQGN